MPQTIHDFDDDRPYRRMRGFPWRRWVLAIGLPVLAALVFLIVTWNAFFKYVPPGKILVLVSKNGAALPAGQMLAEPGQKGVLREVLAEGWHFVMPVIYTTELKDLTVIPSNKAGVVTSLGGQRLASGQLLAENDDEQGIRRHVLLPGAYRLNPYGYTVEQVPAVEIKPGFVGVQRRLLGADNTGRFADKPGEKGILRDVLQPGLYYVNPKEYEIIPSEIGIYQTSYRQEQNNAITFPGRDGNTISIECTIEWEVLPRDIPALVAEFRTRAGVEKNVISVHASNISQYRGATYGAQDFLDGEKRESFQSDFEEELKRVCSEKNVVIRSAFIRNIVIPEAFLKQKRDRQLAIEMRLTNKAKQETATSEAAVQRERSMVLQSEIKVAAETAVLVAGIDREAENITSLTEAEVEKLKATYGAKTAQLDAERKKTMGEAEAEVTKLKETAKSSLYKLKMDVFQNDGNAFMRYTLADQLNPHLVLRLFHSGPGTFWTNMGDKNTQLLLPTAGSSGTPAMPFGPPAPTIVPPPEK
jgi:hypothetical protein